MEELPPPMQDLGDDRQVWQMGPHDMFERGLSTQVGNYSQLFPGTVRRRASVATG